MSTLTEIVHENHEHMIPALDAILATANAAGTVPCDELQGRVEAARVFLFVTLLPHLEAAEESVYPRLEMLLSDTGACGPLRREHDELRRLVAELDRLCTSHRGKTYHRAEALVLRRVLYRIHAIARVHLDEEEEMLGLVARSVDGEEAAVIASSLAKVGTVPL
jgi:hemerythrin-like domain-containing protein